MATTTEHTQAVMAEHLQPAEVVVAATRAQLEGGTMRIATGIGTSVGLGLAAGAVTTGSSADEAGDLGAAFANGLVIAVTDRRVVLLDITSVSAKPKTPVLLIDRAAIDRVVTGEKRVMLVRMTTIVLGFAGPEPRELRFEIPKFARSDGEAVVAALAG